MKVLKISCTLLAAVLLIAVASGFWVSRQCRLWQEQIQSADHLVSRGNRAEAEKKLDALYQSWQGAQSYFNVVVHRDTLDAVESCFRTAAALLLSEDTSSARAALAELSARLQFLADAQLPLARNIF